MIYNYINIFHKTAITCKVSLAISEHMNNINKIKETLQSTIANENENRCNANGFIKENSVEVINYSSGEVSDDVIIYQVVYKCECCYPVLDMLVECSVQNCTIAGFRATVGKDNNNALIIFVARDHHYKNAVYETIKTNDTIIVKIIGVRFEINDTQVSCIAELVEKT
jgi:DNA-directed RNA polymerase subunit E'/Rpb7